MSAAANDPLVVDAGHGLHLAVFARDHAKIDVALRMGEWPAGSDVLFVAASRARVAMDEPTPTGIWFDSAKITLPWLSLLAVADLLRLDIPLPVPLGEQVPA